MPVIRDLKTFREKYSIKVAAEAARRNGVTNQSFSVIEKDGFRDMKLWTLLRYFWALDMEVGILVRHPNGSVHELDMSADFDADHAVLLDNIESVTGVRPKKPKKPKKIRVQVARKPPVKKPEPEKVPENKAPKPPAKPTAKKKTTIPPLEDLKERTVQTLRKWYSQGHSLESIEEKGGMRGYRLALRAAIAALMAEKPLRIYMLGKPGFYWAKNTRDWKKPK